MEGALAQNWLTIPEIVRAAREQLPKHLWDYSCGGAETETTLRRNRSAFDYLALRPRILTGVGTRDTSTTFLGFPLALPVMLAPIGGIERFNPIGAIGPAHVAERCGSISFVSTVAAPAMEEVRASTNGPIVFQIYVEGDRAWFGDFVRRIEQAGFSAICLTVDNAVYGRRERDLHNRYVGRSTGARPNLSGVYAGSASADLNRAALNWEDLEWLRGYTKLPLILKGVACAEDATHAVDLGVDCVYISNHGGRQLDHAQAGIEILPEIVQAVGDRVPVLVDGGFMRGTDVVKGLALGATAVLIGKLETWGLSAGGEAGLERVVELLTTELRVTMGNIGADSLADIGPSTICPSVPPPPDVWPVGSAQLTPYL